MCSVTKDLWLSLGMVVSLVACGGDIGGGADGGGPCSAGESICAGNVFQTCEGGTFQTSETCAGSSVCDDSLGCVECRPEEIRVCQGDDVYECNDDGSVGNYVQTCDFEQCQAGSCGANTACDQGGVELIYVVDSDSRLLSFDPTLLDSDPFTLIGSLQCLAGTAYPDFDPLQGPATPFSMSVDRDGTAWVLYSSGELFHVSTQDASCQGSAWTPGSGGFELFGMGFVADSEGSDFETLYIAGGAAGELVQGDLGTINKDSLAVATVGDLPLEEQSPELTGTGDAKLYGYWPGSIETKIASLNKTSAAQGEGGESWALPSLGSSATAWAFAQWGGKFYVFVTSGAGVQTSQVVELDPTTGSTEVVVENSAYRVVGAGVSTCAPTTID